MSEPRVLVPPFGARSQHADLSIDLRRISVELQAPLIRDGGTEAMRLRGVCLTAAMLLWVPILRDGWWWKDVLTALSRMAGWHLASIMGGVGRRLS